MREGYIASLLGSVTLLTCAPAAAQQIDAGDAQRDVQTQDRSPAATTEGDIVVTAQKREQRLVDVPVAISAVTSETLTTQNLTSLSDYYNRVPSVQFSGNRASQIAIRGITTGGSTNPTVSFLVDDVQIGSSTSLGNSIVPDLDPAILERLEVLRGPQGTLYGASSLGGLIKYVTRTPNTQEFSGRVEIGANAVEDGGYGSSLRGAVNVPVISDHIGISASGFWNRNPEWIDNLQPNPAASGSIAQALLRRDVNRNESWGGRGAIFLKPFDALKVTLSALKQRNETFGAESIYVRSLTDYTSVNNNAAYGSARVGAALPNDRTTSSTALPSFTDYELYTGRADLDLGFGTLTSISAWSSTRAEQLIDVTPVFGFFRAFYPGSQGVQISNIQGTKKFSEELRLGGSVGAFDYLLGGFYTKERSASPQNLFNIGSSANTLAYAGINDSTYREIAGFADLTWHASDRIDVQVGGRYSGNKQSYSTSSFVDTPVSPVFGPSTTVQIARSDETAFTWLVTPSFKITPDTLVFARVATGYRPGGPNTLLPTIPRTFGNDTVTSYELGLKGQSTDRVFSYALSLFQIDWRDIQLQSTDNTSQFTFFVNGSKARSRGIEAEVHLAPWTGFTADANATYTDATLREALPSSTTTTNLIGAKGDRLPASARFTGSVSAQQSVPLTDSLSAFLGGTLAYVGRREGNFMTVAGKPREFAPDYTVIDLRAGMAINGGWSLGLYVRNLTDARAPLIVDTRNGTQTYPLVRFSRPRTIGFTVAGSF